MVCLCVKRKLQLVGTAQLLCQRHCTKSMKKYKENTELTVVIVVFIKDALNLGEQKEQKQCHTTSKFLLVKLFTTAVTMEESDTPIIAISTKQNLKHELWALLDHLEHHQV